MTNRHYLFASIISALSNFISPEVLAQSLQQDLLINADPIPAFSILVQQSTTLARDALDQAFRRNPNLQEIIIVVVGERNGLRAPVVRAKVSRGEWESGLGSVQWTRSLNNAQFLLGFVDAQPIVTQSPSKKPATVESTTTPQPSIQVPEATLENDPGFRDD